MRAIAIIAAAAALTTISAGAAFAFPAPLVAPTVGPGITLPGVSNIAASQANSGSGGSVNAGTPGTADLSMRTSAGNDSYAILNTTSGFSRTAGTDGHTRLHFSATTTGGGTASGAGGAHQSGYGISGYVAP